MGYQNVCYSQLRLPGLALKFVATDQNHIRFACFEQMSLYTIKKGTDINKVYDS
jgi:hypothetical protein